jgi:hypothetical protein
MGASGRDVTVNIEALTRPYFDGDKPSPAKPPIQQFLEHAIPPDSTMTRFAEAEAVAGALGYSAAVPDPELERLLADLPAPAGEITIVWALLKERRVREPGGGPMRPASLLVQAELCRICRRAADRLRGWGVLPGHRDDTAGMVWAFSAFLRISGSCDCAESGCRHPDIHMLAFWLKRCAHTGPRGARKSGHFGLVSWLERACCGHSPPFKLIETFNQGLIAAAEPDLVAAKAAMRACGCDGQEAPHLVAKGRECPRCGTEPEGAISLARKIINKTCYVQERFRKCGGSGSDEHFFELLDERCPACGWEPPVRTPLPEEHQCKECGMWFPVFEATCPGDAIRVPRARGIVQAWVYRPHPVSSTVPPFLQPQFEHVQPTTLRTIGLSAEASELLATMHAEGGARRRAVHQFVRRLALLSPQWRQADGLAEFPSLGEERVARDALERLACWMRTPQDETLLQNEFEQLLTQWRQNPTGP